MRVVAPEDHRGDRHASHGWDPKAPIRDLPKEAVDYLLFAAEGREGRRPLQARARREPLRARRSRAWSRTSSGGTARPTRSTSRPSSRSTWSSGRARRAGASACGRRRSAVTVDGRDISEVADLSITDALDVGARAARAASRSASGRSPARCSRRSGAARVPGRRRAGLPDRRPNLAARCRAARRSGSGWRPRSARR